MSNPFTVFDLEQTYVLDMQILDKSYLKLQQLWHPDRFINGSTEEKEKAQTETVSLNQAYQTLKNPVLRAKVLLNLFFPGVVGAPNPETLEDQFSLQENLASVSEADKIRELHVAIRERIKGVEESFEKDLKDKNIRAFQEYFVLKFLYKIHEDISHKLYGFH